MEQYPEQKVMVILNDAGLFPFHYMKKVSPKNGQKFWKLSVSTFATWGVHVGVEECVNVKILVCLTVVHAVCVQKDFQYFLLVNLQKPVSIKSSDTFWFF